MQRSKLEQHRDVLLKFVGQAVSSHPDNCRKAENNLEERTYTVSSLIRLPRTDDRSCNKTPYINRWDDGPASYLRASDPRYASREECIAIQATLLALALEFEGMPLPDSTVQASAEVILGRALQPGSYVCPVSHQPVTLADLVITLRQATNQVGSAELPVVYVTSLHADGQHRRNNLMWMKPPHELYELRVYLAKHGISKAVFSKLQVKSYCTDKVTMPPFFSNRDHRWATWTKSPQFACRQDCYQVELELLAQILEFRHAPPLPHADRASVEAQLGRSLQPGGRRCPVTGQSLDYQEFVQAANNPNAGYSPYHVGHLHPLTRDGRHVRGNITWMSDTGNRMQGNDTLEEIVATILAAADYHRSLSK